MLIDRTLTSTQTEEATMNLTSAEEEQLALIFECELPEVQTRVAICGNAAIEEYIRMILGQRVFTRGQDVREYRLYLLIHHFFNGRLPSEQQISALFQTTASQSRALLRAVMSKYQYELSAAITTTLDEVLATAAQQENEVWVVTVDSENVIEALNRRLAQIDGTLPQVTRSRNMITTYEIANSAYTALISS